MEEDTRPAGMMDDTEVQNEAHDLIRMGLPIRTEGEGIDITDRTYSLPDVIRIKRTLSAMRKTIDMLGASLADYWINEWGTGLSIDLDGEHHWLAASRRWRVHPGASEAFAAWIIEQDPELVEQIIPPTGVRVSALSPKVRDTFLTNETTSDDLRIQKKRI